MPLSCVQLYVFGVPVVKLKLGSGMQMLVVYVLPESLRQVWQWHIA
jgi:hypothetical protein